MKLHPSDDFRGANWIHGTDHNPVLDLAKETNTIASSIGERSGTYNELGNLMDEQKAEKLSEVVWGIIADAFKHSNEDSSTIPPDRSLRDFFVCKVDEMSLDHADSKVVLQIAQMWGAFVGDPIERQSLKYFWLEESIGGGKRQLTLEKLYLYFHYEGHFCIDHRFLSMDIWGNTSYADNEHRELVRSKYL